MRVDTQTVAKSAVVLTALVCLSAGSAHAQAVRLEVDQSQPLRFNSPVTGVVVGNAGIADVIVHDPKTIFVIGKSVGQTHVMAVDARGRTVFSGNVQVRLGDAPGQMTIQRGRVISSAICNERCVAVPSSEATSQGNGEAISAAKARSGFAAGGGTN